MTGKPKVLVTGATGILGGRLARRLVEDGYPVRALARKASNVAALKDLGVEIAHGDLGDEQAVAAAAMGVRIVVHAGAATSGDAEDHEAATVHGTQNVLKACRECCVGKLVYISSCNVYEIASYAENQVVTEDAQLERSPQLRGYYTAAKVKAEALVTAAMKRDGYPVVVLRPGTIYGPGARVYTNLIGVLLAPRIFVVFGDGESELPLVHLDNVVDAIVECMRSSAADNQIFNVVDQGPVTKKTYVERVIRRLYPNAAVIYVPMPLLLAVTWLQEKLLAILGRRPFLTVYRLLSSQKRIRYSTFRIEQAVGWRSRVAIEQGVEQLSRERDRPPGSGERRAVP
jgi:nucleoside-diphosphate-sugar epimerase